MGGSTGAGRSAPGPPVTGGVDDLEDDGGGAVPLEGRLPPGPRDEIHQPRPPHTTPGGGVGVVSCWEHHRLTHDTVCIRVAGFRCMVATLEMAAMAVAGAGRGAEGAEVGDVGEDVGALGEGGEVEEAPPHRPEGVRLGRRQLHRAAQAPLPPLLALPLTSPTPPLLWSPPNRSCHPSDRSLSSD